MGDTVKAVSAGFSLMIFGVFMAIVMQQLHEKGIIIDEFTTGSITISDLMFITFFMFAIIGLLVILLYRRG